MQISPFTSFALFSFDGSCLYAPLAQLVEQLTLNQWVLGSSPRWCTKRPVGQAVKTPPSHGGIGSSILPRVTMSLLEVINGSIVGVNGCEVPPVPIPNTEVKLIRVEDTWLATTRENRSMPTFKQQSGQFLDCCFSIREIGAISSVG